MRGNLQALFGKRPTKRTRPRAPRRRSTSLDAAGAGNGADLAKGTGVAQPSGKPAEQRPQALPSASHRASPRPYADVIAEPRMAEVKVL